MACYHCKGNRFKVTDVFANLVTFKCTACGSLYTRNFDEIENHYNRGRIYQAIADGNIDVTRLYTENGRQSIIGKDASWRFPATIHKP